MTNLGLKNPKTQKAKSVIFGCKELLSDMHNCRIRGVYNYSPSRPLMHLIQQTEDIKRLTPNFWKNHGKIFARPCPLSPRHGFIDSRIISSNKDLKSLLAEVKEEDPDGEILLMDFIAPAKANAILCSSGLLSIGPGHDGATSGKKSISIPVKPEVMKSNLLSLSGLSSGSNVFIEAVMKESDKLYSTNCDRTFYLTQVRGGPYVKAVNDFIPHKMKVLKVVKPHDDLLAWESEVKKFTPGTVVYGVGHTLASHAAIHCVINNIPFITSKKPSVGDMLIPILNNRTKLDVRAFKLGTTMGIVSTHDLGHMLHLSISILHNWAYIRTSEHASWLLGLASAYFTKVICALTLGEYRHFTKSRGRVSRDDVYKNVINTNRLFYYMRRSPAVASAFTDRKKRISGYGGVRWARAVKMQLSIWNLMANIHDKGLTIKRANKLVQALNKSVNLVHNNGWLFNKISEKYLLDDIAKNPGFAVFQFSDLLYYNYTQMKKIKRVRKVSKISL